MNGGDRSTGGTADPVREIRDLAALHAAGALSDKDPDDRYPSAGAVAAAARAMLDGAVGNGGHVEGATAGGAVRGDSIEGATVRITGPVGPGPLWPLTPLTAGSFVSAAGSGARRGRRGLVVLAAIAAILAVVGGGALAFGFAGQAGGSDVRADGVRTPGDNPFMPPAGDDRIEVTPPPRSGGDFNGGTSGLYGGTLNQAACDPGAMVAFLQANPDKAAAWAGVQGIAPSDIPRYVAALTPVILRSDVAVTNHGFANGRATVVPAVLQAGAAVLVDDFGVPRARCYCGNPLTPATSISAPRYVGPTWAGFSPAAVTNVEPAATPITEFTLVDPGTNEVFVRPAGTGGEADRPAVPSTTTPDPTLPFTPDPTTPGTTPDVISPPAAPGPPVTPPVDPPGAPQPLPDLEPTSIEFDRAALVVDKPVLFDSGIRNAGNVATRDFSIKWFVDGREVGAYGGHAGVPANSTVLDGNSFFTWTFDRPGSYRITFTVDADNHVAESDEEDNSQSVTVEVAGEVSVPKADLVPTAVTFNRAQLSAGSRVDFDSGIKNAGGAGTGVFNIKWFVDGQEVGAYGSHSGVPANTTVLDGNSQFNFTFAEPGRYQVTFTVDADNHVAESDEGNNSQTVTVDIG